MAIPAPVYFLIKEQAKSLVAIKELRERMTAAEVFQNNVTPVFQDIQQQLAHGCNHRRFQTNRTRCYNNEFVNQVPLSHIACSVSGYLKSSDLRLKSSHCSSSVHKPTSNIDNLNGESNRRLIMESDNKQDSGLDSDCRYQGQSNSLTLVSDTFNVNLPDKEEGDQRDLYMFGAIDELSVLLDIINLKGLLLRKQVDDKDQQYATQDGEYHANSQQHYVSRHQTRNNVEVKLQLVEKERSTLCDKITHLEATCHELKNERWQLEERLETALAEKDQLEFHIHELYVQYVKNHDRKDEFLQKYDITEFGSQPKNSQSGKGVSCAAEIGNSSQNKVSSVLKERNVLELQQQLISYVMENEVLQNKVEQLEKLQDVTSVDRARKLSDQIKQLQGEKEELQVVVKSSILELKSMNAKMLMLQKAVFALTQENQEFKETCKSSKQMIPYPKYQHFARPNLKVHSERCDSETQSLPPFLPLETGNPSLNYGHMEGKQTVKDTACNVLYNVNFPKTLCENIRQHDIITSGKCGESLSNSQSLIMENQTSLHCKSSSPKTTLLSCSHSSQLLSGLNTLSYTSPTQHKPLEMCQVSAVTENRTFVSQNETSPEFQCKNVLCNQNLSCNYNTMDNLNKNIHSKQINSICSEFDPLHSKMFQRDQLRRQEFVDSLDLSVPLKPVKSTQVYRQDLPFPRSAANYLYEQRLNTATNLKLDVGHRKQLVIQASGENKPKNLHHHLQIILDRLSAAASDEAL
ncbi:uncharacterized protein LOC106459359 [Limulus polyphemus]|uniref:Uncharacterized protein LOC106459359 n=1 Tax=Limulus polyphemus TaxID=6850 RepID=A0ABM1SDQ2_LIMPO|nr:uncharacterized protein LOC106459359 [Limulus polyphemus]